MKKTRESYHQYLQSEHWADLRKQTCRRDGFRCMLCNGAHHLNVHHRRYPDIWTDTTLDDLVTLCRECHQKFHNVAPPPPDQPRQPQRKAHPKRNRRWYRKWRQKEARGYDFGPRMVKRVGNFILLSDGRWIFKP